MRVWIVLSVVVSAVGLSACHRPAADAPAAPSAAPQAATVPALTAPPALPIAVPAAATPDQVVAVFLNALRTGDSPTTESLLTAKAREELEKHSMSVDVQSAPNAQYEIRAAQVLADNPGGAHVTTVWTEKFDDGDETYEIVWVLRRQAEGWRVAGMAMQLIPDLPAQFLNFENPEDMLKKKEEAMASLQPPAAETAQQPQAQGQVPRSIER